MVYVIIIVIIIAIISIPIRAFVPPDKKRGDLIEKVYGDRDFFMGLPRKFQPTEELERML